MPPNELKPGYLKYLHGEAGDKLNTAFDANERVNDEREADVPADERYRAAFADAINTYCVLFDQAGKSVASIVQRLPYVGTFEYEDALLGMRILEETRMALDELLESDKDFYGALVDPDEDDPDRDKEVRSAAQEFDDHHEIGSKNAIEQEQAERTKSFDEQVRDGFYDGQDADQVDDNVAHSARETLDGMGEIKIYTFDKDPDEKEELEEEEDVEDKEEEEDVEDLEDGPEDAAKPEKKKKKKKAPAKKKKDAPKNKTSEKEANPEAKEIESQPQPEPQPSVDTRPAAIRLYGERARVQKVQIPDFKGRDPIIVFRQSSEWMVNQIIAVASGSAKENSFPRIAPIVRSEAEHKEGDYTTTDAKLQKITRDLRRKVKRLRPPMGEGTFDLESLMGDYFLRDPNDSQGMQNLIGEMMNRFRKREPKNEGGEEGWKSEDDDGEGWRNGNALDDEDY